MAAWGMVTATRCRTPDPAADVSAANTASTAAVANAVIDALAPFGVRHLDMPYTPQTVWRAMHAGKGGRA